MRLLFFVLALFISLFSISQTTPSFQSLLNSYYDNYLQLHPTVATSIGDYRYNDRLENALSQTYRDQVTSLYMRYLDSLKQFNSENLTPRDQLSYKILKYDLERQLRQLQNPTWLDPVNQFRDFRLSFSQLGAGTGNHPF